MTQPNDAQDAVSKLQVAVDLLKRLDDEGVREVFPAVCDLAEEVTTSESVEAFVGRYNGTAAEYAAGYARDSDDEIPTSAYAFAITVKNCDHSKTDAEIAERVRRGIHESIIGLCKVDRAEQVVGAP